MAARRCVYSTPIPKNYQPTGKYSDQLARLATWCLLQTALTEERRFEGHYFPCASRQWRELFGSVWPFVRKAAIASGLIESNERYSTGRHGTEAFPKSIRLSKQHRRSGHRLYELSRKPRAKYQPRDLGPGPVGAWLYANMKQFRLRPTTTSNWWDMLAMERVSSGHLYATRCEYRRFHSNFTSMSRGLRSALYIPSGDYAGEPLVQLDVRSCQPLLLGALARTEIDHADVCDWIELCEEGVLYEHLVDLLRTGIAPACDIQKKGYVVHVDPSTFDRDKAKKALCVAMFSKVDDMLRNPAYIAMQHGFPVLANWILQRKRRDGYQSLAAKAQRSESWTVIDTACKRLMQANPCFPVLTVHDCVVVPESLATQAGIAMTSAFASEAKVRASIKQEAVGE